MPEIQCHLSKVKKFPHPEEKNETRGMVEEDDPKCNAVLKEIQNDLNYINETCHKLKNSADCVDEKMKSLILQSWEDAFKERSQRTEALGVLQEAVSILKNQFFSSPQFSPDSFPSTSSAMRTDSELQNQQPSVNVEEEYGRLDATQKNCLLCFSVFPEDEIIKKKVLIHWWIGEGFIDGENAEDTGNVYFKGFINKGIIELVRKKRRDKSENCKMQTSIRSAIIRLAISAKFVGFNSKGNPTANFSSSHRVCLVNTEEGSSLHDLTYIYHYLNQENIQTLFNVNEPRLNFRVARFSKMKKLKVLQLGRWKASAKQLVEVENTEFLKGLKKMKELRYFSLRGISGITELPNSICKLSELRILNLSGCDNLGKLPDGIGSLKQLTHLDMSECYLISHMPKGLTCLSELRVLKGFVIGTQRSRGHYCKLADLAVLQHLKKLSIHVDRTSDEAKKELVSFPQFRNLRSLSVAWSRIYDASIPTTTNVALATIHRIVSREKSIKTLGSSSQLVALGKLGLQDFHGSKLPGWLNRLNLKELKKLYIRGGELSDLHLMEDRTWPVKCLRLKSLSQLRMDWPGLQQLFPDLTYVEKVDCPHLISFPCDEINGEWIRPKADTEQA